MTKCLYFALAILIATEAYGEGGNENLNTGPGVGLELYRVRRATEEEAERTQIEEQGQRDRSFRQRAWRQEYDGLRTELANLVTLQDDFFKGATSAAGSQVRNQFTNRFNRLQHCLNRIDELKDILGISYGSLTDGKETRDELVFSGETLLIDNRIKKAADRRKVDEYVQAQKNANCRRRLARLRGKESSDQ